MKDRIKLLVSVLLTLPLIGVIPAAAVAHAETTTSSTTKPLITQATDAIKADTAQLKQALQARIQARKDKLQVRLSALEQQRLKTRCKSSQGVVSSLQARINGIETAHTKAHTHVVSQLTDLSAKLPAQGLDNTQLQTEITNLNAQIAKFNSDFATYKDDVSDLAVMDCAADPVGFKASLEASRNQMGLLRQEGTAIQAYLKDTIKPTLQTIRTQIAAKQGGDSK